MATTGISQGGAADTEQRLDHGTGLGPGQHEDQGDGLVHAMDETLSGDAHDRDADHAKKPKGGVSLWHDGVDAEAIAAMDRDGLLDLWRRRFKRRPPKYVSVLFLRKALAFEVQLARQGGHSKAVRNALEACLSGTTRTRRKRTVQTGMGSSTEYSDLDLAPNPKGGSASVMTASGESGLGLAERAHDRERQTRLHPDLQGQDLQSRGGQNQGGQNHDGQNQGDHNKDKLGLDIQRQDIQRQEIQSQGTLSRDVPDQCPQAVPDQSTGSHAAAKQSATVVGPDDTDRRTVEADPTNQDDRQTGSASPGTGPAIASAQRPRRPKAPTLVTPAMLRPGTRLVREWNGRTYVADVVEDGFVMDGKVYGSLTACARRITGTAWSGPRFFGLAR